MKTLYMKEKELIKSDKYLADTHDKYTYVVTVELVFDRGFKWIIKTSDISVMGKGLFSLPQTVIDAIDMIEENNPRYYRLEEHTKNKIRNMEREMAELEEALYDY